MSPPSHSHTHGTARRGPSFLFQEEASPPHIKASTSYRSCHSDRVGTGSTSGLSPSQGLTALLCLSC